MFQTMMRRAACLLFLLCGCSGPQPPPEGRPAPRLHATHTAAASASAGAAAFPTLPPFKLQACQGLAAMRPRGITARTAGGTVTFFIEHRREGRPSGRPGPNLTPTLVSFDPQGKQRWRLKLGTIDSHISAPWPLAVTPAGDAVVAGSFEGQMDVGTPPIATPPPSWSQPQPYLVRVSRDGKVTLARSLADIRDGGVQGLALAPGGDAIVGVSAAMRDYRDPQQSTVARLDAAGNIVWQKDFAGLTGPVPLAGHELALVSWQFVREQPGGSHRLVVLDARNGDILREQSWPIRAFQTSLGGSESGRLHMLLYSPNTVAELGLKERLDTMSLLTFNHKLEHLITRQVKFSNGKTLATDERGRPIVTHMRAFDDGIDPVVRPADEGPTFFEGIGAQRADKSEQQVRLSSSPIAVTAEGAMVGQRLQLCLDCSISCRSEGRCKADGTSCVPSSDEDCKRSAVCRVNGRCSLRDGHCVATNDAMCAASERCRQKGNCAVNENGFCHVAQTAHCAQSSLCKEDGDCTLFNGECRPSKASHCRSSISCRKHSTCHLRSVPDGGHTCSVKTAADCARSEGCRLHGRCSLREGSMGGQWCAMRNDADCRKSQACRERGACSATTAHLGDSVVVGYCEVTSDEDCKRSSVCRRRGHCRLVGRACAK